MCIYLYCFFIGSILMFRFTRIPELVYFLQGLNCTSLRCIKLNKQTQKVSTSTVCAAGWPRGATFWTPAQSAFPLYYAAGWLRVNIYFPFKIWNASNVNVLVNCRNFDYVLGILSWEGETYPVHVMITCVKISLVSEFKRFTNLGALQHWKGKIVTTVVP